jgi:hypothetical protein
MKGQDVRNEHNVCMYIPYIRIMLGAKTGFQF